MLKKKQFTIQKEDEEDFEAFLTNLNKKRNQDLSQSSLIQDDIVKTVNLVKETEISPSENCKNTF